jgi:hypothetical protein
VPCEFAELGTAASASMAPFIDPPSPRGRVP